MSTVTPHKHIARSNTHDERFPVTVKCNNCDSTFRVYCIGPIMQTHKYKCCVCCGSNRIYVFIDTEQDYWEILAKSYNMTPEAIKVMYELWEPSDSTKTFAQHVKETRKLMSAIKKAAVNV